MLNSFLQWVQKLEFASRPLHQEIKPILENVYSNALFQCLAWSQLLEIECQRAKDKVLPFPCQSHSLFGRSNKHNLSWPQEQVGVSLGVKRPSDVSAAEGCYKTHSFQMVTRFNHAERNEDATNFSSDKMSSRKARCPVARRDLLRESEPSRRTSLRFCCTSPSPVAPASQPPTRPPLCSRNRVHSGAVSAVCPLHMSLRSFLLDDRLLFCEYLCVKPSS